MTKLKLGLSALMLSSLSACFFDSESSISKAGTASDNCGTMIFSQGNNYKEKTGRLYASSVNGACTWEISTYNDSRITVFGDYAYLLEGYGSHKLTRIEAKTGKVLYQLPLASGSNPHSIGFLNDTMGLVPSFGGPNLYKIHLTRGVILDSLDMSALAATGTKSPAPEDILIKDGMAYVVLQRQDSKWKSANQIIAKVNPTTMKITDSVALKTTNTFQLIAQGNKIVAISKGNTDYDANWNESSRKDGGIEVVDFTAKTSEIVLDETAIGGKPVHAALRSDGKFYVGVYKKFGSIPMALVDLSAKSVTASDKVVNAWGGFALDSKTGILYASDDNGKNTGVYAYDNWTLNKTYFDGMIAPYSTTIRP